MLDDPQAPTAPLDEFLEEFLLDENIWWRIGCGHHLNLLSEALEKLIELRERDVESD